VALAASNAPAADALFDIAYARELPVI